MTAQYAKPQVLVETDWVEQHLGDPKIKLVEVDVDTTAYESGHIPGAIDWSWQADLNDPITRDIISKEGFERLMHVSGISNDDTIVLYGDNNNWFAAFAYWVCKIYGHKDVRLMNGGRKKWLAENRPLTKERPVVTPSTYRAQDPDLSIRAFREDILRRLKSPGLALVDVRSPQEFTGEILAPPARRAHPRRGQHPLVAGGARGRHLQVGRGTGPALSVARGDPGQGGHRLLPHRRALLAHLVRPARAAGVPQRQELRRLLDRVGLDGGDAHREALTRRRASGQPDR